MQHLNTSFACFDFSIHLSGVEKKKKKWYQTCYKCYIACCFFSRDQQKKIWLIKIIERVQSEAICAMNGLRNSRKVNLTCNLPCNGKSQEFANTFGWWPHSISIRIGGNKWCWSYKSYNISAKYKEFMCNPFLQSSPSKTKHQGIDWQNGKKSHIACFILWKDFFRLNKDFIGGIILCRRKEQNNKHWLLMFNYKHQEKH